MGILGIQPPRASFVIGVALAVTFQLAMGWWLDAGRRVAVVLITVAAVTLLTANSTRHAIALWAGTMAGMTGVLFWIGPGNLWPIVLVFAAVLTGISVMVGWAVRRALGQVKKGRAA